MATVIITHNRIEDWGAKLENDYQEALDIGVVAATDWNCECDKLQKNECKVTEISSEGAAPQNMDSITRIFYKMQQALKDQIPPENRQRFTLIFESLVAQREEMLAVVRNCVTLESVSSAFDRGTAFEVQLDRVRKVPIKMIGYISQQEQKF